MPIPVTCSCGKTFSAPDNLTGKRVKCPQCGEPLDIPQATASSEPTGSRQAGATKAKRRRIKCDCGKAIELPSSRAGKAIQCPSCGKTLPTSSRKAKTTKTSSDDVGDLLDEVDLAASTTGHRCPICRTDLDPEAILCVKCGYSFETGKKIKTKTSRKAPPAVRKDAAAKPPKTGIASKINGKVAFLIALLVALPIVAYFVLSRMPAS